MDAGPVGPPNVSHESIYQGEETNEAAASEAQSSMMHVQPMTNAEASPAFEQLYHDHHHMDSFMLPSSQVLSGLVFPDDGYTMSGLSDTQSSSHTSENATTWGSPFYWGQGSW